MRSILVLASLLVASPALAYWQLDRIDNKMDGTTKLVLTASGNEPYPGSVSGTKPRLIIRCETGRADMIIDAEVILDNNTGELHTHAVRLRFDDGKPERAVATEATNGTAAFLPNGRGLIRRLLKTRKIMIEVTPFRMGNAVSTFDVAGLGDHASSLARDCGIK